MILLSLTAITSGQNLIGFAPHYRSFSADFDYTIYTHVIFFAVWPDSSGNLLWPGGNDSTYIYNKYEAIRSNAQPEGVSVLVAFGGTSEAGSKYFPQMAMDSSALDNFTARAIDLCKKWGADGIDIDWEWGEKLEPEDDMRTGYEDLMTQLRAELDQDSLMLTTDVSASSWFGDNYPPGGVDQAHLVNVMSYTYNGSWSSTANHHSPLSKTRDTGLAYWTGKGIAKLKINVGVPFFAQEYTCATARNEAFSSMQALTYTEITNRISSGYKVVEDNENGTYCYSDSNSKIAFYDSPDNLEHKMIFARDNEYAGVFIWEIGQDDADQSLSNTLFDAKADVVISSGSTQLPGTEYQISYITNSLIHITGIEKGTFKATLFNMEGKKLNDYQSNSQLITINSNQFPGGIYILTIDNGNSIVKSKLLLQH